MGLLESLRKNLVQSNNRIENQTYNMNPFSFFLVTSVTYIGLLTTI
jgi:hypothetical protein